VSIEELLQTLTGVAGDGTAVFFSSHQIAEVERIADRVSILDRGRLAADLSLASRDHHSPGSLLGGGKIVSSGVRESVLFASLCLFPKSGERKKSILFEPRSQ
jgi:ABC-type uncharacterized transport system ATPase subunit